LEKPTCYDVMKSCPRFQSCCVPICPLDPLQDRRTYLKGEPKCALPKATRIRLAAGTDLPRKGMTKKEWSATQSWESMSEDEKLSRKANLRTGPPVCTENLNRQKDNGGPGRIRRKTSYKSSEVTCDPDRQEEVSI